LAQSSALNEIVATVRRHREELDAALAATEERLDAATRARHCGCLAFGGSRRDQDGTH